MERKAIEASAAPAPLGAYSHAVSAGGFLFTAGQLPIDPLTGKPVEGDIGAQVRQAIRNIRAVLRAAELDLVHVVKVTVYLADISQARAANAAYAEFFVVDPPARTTVGAALPPGCAVEIDAVAAYPDKAG